MSGHTILSMDIVVGLSRELATVHQLPLDSEIVDILRDEFQPVISVSEAGSETKIQLDRYVKSGKLIQSAVDQRLNNVPKRIKINWRELVNREFNKQDIVIEDADEDVARAEKATALECLADSRFSVLVGPAGTGKTTVLRILLGQGEDRRNTS